jgi:Zn-dependent M28 family amino/carboxypeptidase
MKKILIAAMAVMSFAVAWAQSEITESALKAHVEYLASDKLAGREPGTKGEKLAYQYIQKEFQAIGLIPMGEKGYLQPFTYKTMMTPHDTVAKGKNKKGTNVIGYLDNGAAYTIVIGGHYDHLGAHEHGSSLDKDKQKGVIHNGADDNASGTAGVMALARYFANNATKENTNFLFMCYSAEEDGLIGSKYYTNHPTMDLNKITCMINMDMVGRLNDSTKKVMVFGVGTSPAYTSIFSGLNTPLTLSYDSSGVGPSDQTSFYLKNIPVLHFFSGQHLDYHKSTDDAEKINYAGEKQILELIADIANRISNQPKLAFTTTKQAEQSKVSFKVTLGIMPDYSYSGKGVKADAVTAGKPAALAGIIANDIVVKLGDKAIENIYDYMKLLAIYKKGDTTSVEVLRNNEVQKLQVTF